VENVDGVIESADGVVDGVVDGVDSPAPMFGQSLVDVAAMYEWSATAAVDELTAVPDELVAAWATAPPASAAVAAMVTTTLRERGNICVHLLSWVSAQ
jgi:hypothetical protein